MVTFNQTLVVAFAMSVTAWSAAYAVASPLPQELLVGNKPVEPYCMTHFTGENARLEPLDLGQCNTDSIVTSGTVFNGEEDTYGYEYSYKEDTEGFAKSYIYYSYIGHHNGLPLVLLKESGGGSGRFSSLVALQRQDNTLILKDEIAGGDRCNGGVEAEIKDNVLYYDQHITPYDFLALAVDNVHELGAYDDLEASASSCFGKAHYQDGQLVEVTLTGTGEDIEGWTENSTYQPCFNTIYRKYLKEGKTRLNKEELKQFTHHFNTSCVEHLTQSE